MRPKILLLGFLTLFVLFAAVWVRSIRRTEVAGEPPPVPTSRPEPAIATRRPLAREKEFGTADFPANNSGSIANLQTNTEEFIEDRDAELMALAMNNDAESLRTIMAELTNPDKRIRAGALEAAVQFGDRSITPRLQELASQADDAEEKAALLEAVEYINLPSLTEHIAANQAKNRGGAPSNAPARAPIRTNRGWPGGDRRAPNSPAN